MLYNLTKIKGEYWVQLDALHSFGSEANFKVVQKAITDVLDRHPECAADLHLKAEVEGYYGDEQPNMYLVGSRYATIKEIEEYLTEQVNSRDAREAHEKAEFERLKKKFGG